MNKEKIKILLKLYRDDSITEDEFIILVEEDKKDTSSFIPSLIPTQPFINNPPQPFNAPYYTSGTSTIDVTKTQSNTNSSANRQSTIGGIFSKNWINPEEPKF